ncbi:MAG: TerB family tellurite resistance protein [Flavobacteriaceae bacterium]
MAIAKWLGTSLGWAFFGPIGALIGFALGSAIDKADPNQKRIQYNPKRKTQRQQRPTRRERDQRQQDNTKPGDFEISFLILAAVIIKADNTVDKRELDYVRQHFIKIYGSRKAENAFKLFNGIMKKKVATTAVCAQIREHMDHASRLQLIHFLFGISKADGNVHDAEVEEIRKIAGYLYVSDRDFKSIKAMFYDEKKSAYEILEISKAATNDEVKKAYRKMVKKHHPDKLQHLGEEHVKVAQEKFRKIQEAYEIIGKERGL